MKTQIILFGRQSMTRRNTLFCPLANSQYCAIQRELDVEFRLYGFQNSSLDWNSWFTNSWKCLL